MQCPSFRISKYGVFDGSTLNIKGPYTKERCVVRYELELITSDCAGSTFLNGVEYPLKRGLFICAKPGHLRYSRLPMRCHYVHILTEDETLLPLLRQLPDACLLSSIGPVAKLFQELVELPDSETVEARLLLQSAVARLLTTVFRATQAETRAANLVSRSHRAILIDTDEYIRNNLSSPLTLELLAERASFSPAHFHRIFSAFFGKTPHEYVQDCRIAAARAALQSDSCTLSDLAAACGFSSHSYFSHQFKKATGQSPMQYRRRMLSRLEG